MAFLEADFTKHYIVHYIVGVTVLDHPSLLKWSLIYNLLALLCLKGNAGLLPVLLL